MHPYQPTVLVLAGSNARVAPAARVTVAVLVDIGGTAGAGRTRGTGLAGNRVKVGTFRILVFLVSSSSSLGLLGMIGRGIGIS